MRTLLALTGGAVLAGCAGVLPPLVTVAGLALTLLALLVDAPPGGRRRVAAAVAIGLLWGAWVTRPADPLPARELTVTGTVYAVICEQAPRCRVTLADAALGDEAQLRRVDVWYDDLEEPPATGHQVRLTAVVGRPRQALDPTPFVAAAQPIRPYLQGRDWPASTDGAPTWSTALATALRARLDLADPHATALYRALLLGDKRDLDAETRWAFQDTGTAHLLAISGLHLALIGFGLRALLLALLLRVRRLAQGARVPALAAALALPLLWAYTEVAAPSDATRRALVFIGLVLLGDAVGRRARGRRTLLLAAAAGLLADPLALLRPGFQLSFAAAGALVLGAPLGRAVIAFWNAPGRLHSRLARRIAVAVSALVLVDALTFLATAPLTAAWFGQVAPHGLWVNLVAVPAATLIVLPLGGLWAVLSLLVPPLAAWLAPVPSAVGGAFVTAIQGVAGAVGPSSAPGWSVPLAVAVTGAFLLLLASRRARWPALGGLVALSLLAAFLARDPPAGLEVTALDVGHGDALLVRLPRGGTLLVDAGGAWQGGAADQRQADRRVIASLLHLGVAELDALAITHADRDHIGGALTVVERIPVRSLWIPRCALGTPRGMDLARAVLARGGTVLPMEEQAPLDWEGVELEVLWPPPDQVGWDGRCAVVANDSSLTLALRYAGRAVLLTGDIEAPDEAALLRRGADLRADVLKAPHHGSRTSSTPAFLDRVAPRHVIVSGLPGRAPMPPHDDVLARYRERGARVWITGRDGAVTTRITPDGRIAVSALGVPGDAQGPVDDGVALGSPAPEPALAWAAETRTPRRRGQRAPPGRSSELRSRRPCRRCDGRARPAIRSP